MKKKGFDAIIVLFGGLEKDGTPHPWVISRLDKALEFSSGSKFIVLAGRGTPYRPSPRDKNGFAIDECAACAKYLIFRGFNPKKIILENVSMDTIGNGYFTRFLLAEPMRLRKILIVTSEFHMPRSKEILKWIYALKPTPIKYKLEFEESPNIGFGIGLGKLKAAREIAKLKKLKTLIKKIKTMRQMREFIFFKHGVYSCSGKVEKLKGEIVKTY